MIPPFDQRPEWFKGRGYLHITPKINIRKNYFELYALLNDPSFIAKHAFFPLIHAVIKERKYKKIPNGEGRAHSFIKDGEHLRSEKIRPLHYATHIDALIFSCYAARLSELYEEQLSADKNLNDCVIAYRKIPVEDPDGENLEEVGKSTIHFAYEAFEEIKHRSQGSSCAVLMFDIKSFFSELDHQQLKEAWCDLRGVNRLFPADFNVFRAATDFRYILRDELRTGIRKYGKRNGFDEAKLSDIRKHYGKEAFFSSVEDFKSALEQKKLKVYKHPFTKKRQPVGIPQGLPISAVLANLYLLNFDKKVLEVVVDTYKGFYRRYSDDIMIICKPEDAAVIEKFILAEIKKSKIEISPGKTEKFRFEYQQISPRINRLTSTLVKKNKEEVPGKPLTYLGFEFYGYKTLIKSANVAKFYRRMIYAVRKHAHRANQNYSGANPAIYIRQLKKLYSDADLRREKKKPEFKVLRKNEKGYFSFQKIESKSDPRSRTNYFSYSARASKIMNESKMSDQLKRHRSVFHAAMHKHLK
ncbi:reverse transcriptase domain-containing protein [Mucilaginibacter sp. Mucisp84]|uniref:reverse transcriptase domain-containing protein n=1 Tax=Mucilaginibacter sp. Mucisp84 TaxID=3243058 RepID=UPI0039A67AE4